LQVPASPTSNISGSVQVAVVVPNLADGDYPVVVMEGGTSSPSTTLLTVQK
jgi:uncharacterized protein (TIGR03437 family)